MDELTIKNLKNKFFHRAISKAINDKKILYSKNVDHDLSEVVGESFNLISNKGELLASIPLEDLRKKPTTNGCLIFIFCSGAAFVSLFVSFMVAFWNSEGFWPISANSSRAKSVLVEAIKDCFIKKSDGIDKPTFEDIGLPEMPLHSEWPQDIYSFYPDNSFSKPIQESDSCFSLAAKPSTNKLTWFSIKLDPKDGMVIKKCGDSEKRHCEEGNSW